MQMKGQISLKKKKNPKTDTRINRKSEQLDI